MHCVTDLEWTMSIGHKKKKIKKNILDTNSIYMHWKQREEIDGNW